MTRTRKKRGMTRKAKRAINRAKFRESRSRSSKTARSSGTRKRSKKRRRLSKKEYVARRVQTSRDYVAYKKHRSSTFGPVPFELQPSWLRAKQSRPYRAKRARWAKARSSR